MLVADVVNVNFTVSHFAQYSLLPVDPDAIVGAIEQLVNAESVHHPAKILSDFVAGAKVILPL